MEKPSVTGARSLIESGALWNIFIIVGAIQRLIDLFRPQWRALIAEMQLLVAGEQSAGCEDTRGSNLAEKYECLPEVDFSRHVLAGQESALRLMRVRPCGWSDLGTPRRVSEMLGRLPPRDYAAAVSRRSAYVNLAAQHDRMQRQA